MNDYINISVLVPSDRVEEFYENFAAWLRKEPLIVAADDVAERSDLTPWFGGDDAHEQMLAAEVWAKLSDRAKALFELLSREPGRKFSAKEIGDALEIPNGMYGVAGVLAWPARHCAAVGQLLPILYEEGSPGEGARYWMSEEAAESFVPVMKG